MVHIALAGEAADHNGDWVVSHVTELELRLCVLILE